MRDLNCIPPDQHDQGWALLRSMVIAVIDEVKKSDASTDVNDSIEDVINFFWINETHYLQCLLLSLVCWLWDSIWMVVMLALARTSDNHDTLQTPLLVNRNDQKMTIWWKQLHGNREIVVNWTVGVVGAQGQLTQGPNVPNPCTKYKRSKNIFDVASIELTNGRDWPRLVHPLAQSLIGSPGTGCWLLALFMERNDWTKKKNRWKFAILNRRVLIRK